MQHSSSTVEARACAPPSSGLGGCRHYWDQPRGCSMFNWGPVRICFKPSTSQGRPIPKGARELMGHSLGTLGWEKNRPHALPSYGLLSIGAPTPPHHWAGRGPRSTHVSTGRSAGCPARPRGFFIFIFFKNIFYRNIFSVSYFTVLYPYRPAGGGRDLHVNKHFFLRGSPWREPAARPGFSIPTGNR